MDNNDYDRYKEDRDKIIEESEMVSNDFDNHKLEDYYDYHSKRKTMSYLVEINS